MPSFLSHALNLISLIRNRYSLSPPIHECISGEKVRATHRFPHATSFHLRSLSHVCAIAQALMWDNCKRAWGRGIVWFMSDSVRERPAVISPRVYKRHREIIKRAARKLKASEAAVVRQALESFVY
jgi:hypothetical protein